MKITKTGTSSKRRLTINDIPCDGGEVIEVGGRVYLYPIVNDYEIDYPGYEMHTVFIDLANGELVPLRDDSECRLIKDAELKYNNDNLIEWVE